jgi:predicted transcriptional regulator
VTALNLDRLTNCDLSLAQSAAESDNPVMTEKEIVLATIQALPDDCSIEEIAERIEFMAAVRKGLDQLDRGESIPHEEVKKQLASWLTS